MRAQNAEAFYYSEDAALMAGAVSARPADNASLWYNPAGLAAITRARVTASGSVFGVRVRNIPDAMVTRLGGEEVALDLDSTDIVAVPHALSTALQIAPGVTVAGGLFATVRDVRQAADDVIDQRLAGTGVTVSERLDLQSDTTKYALGPGIGFTVAEGLRLGFAPFVTYRTDASIVQYALGVTTPEGTTEQLGQGSGAETFVGLTGVVGLQADLSETVHVGFVVRLPELFLYGASDGGGVIASGQSGGAADVELEIIRAVDPDSGGGLLAPPRFTAGVLLTPTADLALGVDLDLQTGLHDSALLLAKSPVFNGRLGVRAAVSDALVLGGGVFTDLAPEQTLTSSLGDEVVDWVGASFGATLRTPVARAEAPEKKDGLVLSTTLALRYGVGFGRARALLLAEEPGLPSREVTYHDVMPFFGSSILF